MPYIAEELLERIFQFLQFDKSTLTSICLVCKTFRRLAQGYLFQRLEIVSNARPILLTLLRKPHVAKEVRNVDLEIWDTCKCGEHYPARTPGADAELENLSGRVLASMPVSHDIKQDICTSLKQGLEDAAVAVLLAVCPNVESLRLSSRSFADGNVVEKFLKGLWGDAADFPNIPTNDCTSELPLSRVRDINIHHWDTEGAASLSVFFPLFRLPRLESFYGNTVTCDFFETGPFMPPDSSTVKVAMFTSSLLDAEDLSVFLAACPKLEELSLEWGNYIVGDCEIRYDLIAQALSQRGRGLRKVEFDSAEADWIQSGETSVHPPIGDLRALTSLRELTVPEIALLGQDDASDDSYPNFIVPDLVNTLPESLERLEIKDCFSETPDQLDEQLFSLITDTRFAKLSLVKVYREKLFARKSQLVGWNGVWDGHDEWTDADFWAISKGPDSIE